MYKDMPVFETVDVCVRALSDLNPNTHTQKHRLQTVYNINFVVNSETTQFWVSNWFLFHRAGSRIPPVPNCTRLTLRASAGVCVCVCVTCVLEFDYVDSTHAYIVQ